MKNLTLLILLLFFHPAQSNEHLQLNLPDRSGNTVHLSDYKGKVILVDFWASWCVPCRASFPWMNTMQKKYHKQGLQILAINLDKEAAEVERFLAQYPASFKILLDPQGQTAKQFDVKGMPSSYLFDRNGNLVHQHIGYRLSQQSHYEQQIQELLKQ